MTSIGEILAHSGYPISSHIDWESPQIEKNLHRYAILRELKEPSKVEICFVRAMEGLLRRQHPSIHRWDGIVRLTQGGSLF